MKLHMRSLIPGVWCLLLAGAADAAQTVAITVHANQVRHTVSEKEFHGINFCALWNDTGASPGTTQSFSRMGMRLVRFPGGCPAQWYDWQYPLASGFTSLTPEMAWDFAKAGGARVVFQTNVANDGGGTNKTTRVPYRFDSSGAHAADWVRFCAAKGISVPYWEIGNERELDAPAAAKGNSDRVYAWYNKKFAEQALAIKRADPQAKVMGPSECNTWFWWAQKDLERFLRVHGNKQGSGLVDAVSLHWYPEGGSGSWEQKRGMAQQWPAQMDYIRGVLKQYDSRDLPLFITEWNWGAGEKCDGARKLSNALGVADIVGMFLRTGVSGHAFFVLQKIDRGWGVLAMKADSRPQNEASPTYYALCISSLLGGAVLDVTNSVDEKNVLSAYATRHADGSVQALLINKTKDQLPVEIAFSGYSPLGKTMTVYTLEGATGSINDQDVIYNGVARPKPSEQELPGPRRVLSTQAVVTVDVAPFSIQLLTWPRERP